MYRGTVIVGLFRVSTVGTLYQVGVQGYGYCSVVPCIYCRCTVLSGCTGFL